MPLNAIAKTVLATTRRGADTRSWDWVDASVWTDHMLAALENGVKGGQWYSLKKGWGKSHQTHRRWPNAFFAEHGLFTLHEAHAVACQSR